jgi:hypothetical protein
MDTAEGIRGFSVRNRHNGAACHDSDRSREPMHIFPHNYLSNFFVQLVVNTSRLTYAPGEVPNERWVQVRACESDDVGS